MRPALIALLMMGCEAPQLMVQVDTDATVPPSVGEPPHPWLFDALRVELLRAGAPAAPSGTRRDFALDEAMFRERRVSFGIAPPFGQHDLTLRVRMFRADHAQSGEPWPGATLEHSLALPPISDGSGHTHIVVRMKTDDVGKVVSGPAVRGTVEKSEVASWPGAQVVPCAREAGTDEACIPGGAFWMGDPVLRDLGDERDAHRERLVVLSPFFIDTREVTVADFRAGPTASNFAINPQPWEGTSDPMVFDNWCTYTPRAPRSDPEDTHAALAVNCIAQRAAIAYCERKGGSLPSEAQFEFAASGAGEERAFAWGEDEPNCDDAVWGWGGLAFTFGYNSSCRTADTITGAREPGRGRRDRVTYGDREVLDLAGNLTEWTRDKWSRQDEGFWSAEGVLVDPVADLVSPEDGANLATVRGGHWHDPPLFLRAATRRFARNDRDTFYFWIGFRCVRTGM